jgi:oxygen-independent coproporphyrinogen III oxidase
LKDITNKGDYISSMVKDKKSLSIYIHIPFCRARCGYCDFNTYAGLDHLIDEYIDAVVKEIIRFSKGFASDHIVHTIYFGGGTPTILPTEAFQRILSAIHTHFQVSERAEISSEANPENLGLKYMKGLQLAGVNRLSIGMQSAVENELNILGRVQKLTDVKTAVENVNTAGINNINLDLIFGIPTQTMETLKISLDTAVALTPTHLSIYGLLLGGQTQLSKNIQSRRTPEIDEDIAGDMYGWLMDVLPDYGYKQYEISNWSFQNEKNDYRCIHNVQYWKNFNYLGIGTGAHSFVERGRWRNVNLIAEYISGINNTEKSKDNFHHAIAEHNQLEKTDVIKETMMMGLRLTEEGINIAQFKKRFSMELDSIYKLQINKLISLGLLEIVPAHGSKTLRLTAKGRAFGNQVFLEFL